MARPIPHPSLDDVPIEAVLTALADPVRLSIVRMADAQDCLPCSAFIAAIPRSTMSHHWRVLREAGVIRQEPNGTQQLNSVRRAELEARFPGLLDAVLANAPVDASVRRDA